MSSHWFFEYPNLYKNIEIVVYKTRNKKNVAYIYQWKRNIYIYI